jgi:hypothetical protein
VGSQIEPGGKGHGIGAAAANASRWTIATVTMAASWGSGVTVAAPGRPRHHVFSASTRLATSAWVQPLRIATRMLLPVSVSRAASSCGSGRPGRAVVAGSDRPA